MNHHQPSPSPQRLPPDSPHYSKATPSPRRFAAPSPAQRRPSPLPIRAMASPQRRSSPLPSRAMASPQRRPSPLPRAMASPHRRPSPRPMNSRSLSELNSTPMSGDITIDDSLNLNPISPVYLSYTRQRQNNYFTARPSLPQPKPPSHSQAAHALATASNFAYDSSSEEASTIDENEIQNLSQHALLSTPSSPSRFEYSTSATSTPEIWNLNISRDDTPVMKNTNPGAILDSPSTLRSMTPRPITTDWWVPRPSDPNPSPMSLPSMLGAPSFEVSELESPILLQEFNASEEESDIQSQSIMSPREEESEILSTGGLSALQTPSTYSGASASGAGPLLHTDPTSLSTPALWSHAQSSLSSNTTRDTHTVCDGTPKDPPGQKQYLAIDQPITNQLFFGPSLATPSPRAHSMATYTKDDIAARKTSTRASQGAMRSQSLQSHHEEEELEPNHVSFLEETDGFENIPEDKSEDDQLRCYCFWTARFFALLAIALAVTIAVAIVLLQDDGSSMARTIEPIDPLDDPIDRIPTVSTSPMVSPSSRPVVPPSSSPVVLDTTASPTSQMVAPIPPPTAVPVVRPTTPGGGLGPIARPSAPTAAPPPPIQLPIWSSVLQGEDFWEDVFLDDFEIAWPSQSSALQMQVASTVDDRYQGLVETTVQRWQSASSSVLNLTMFPAEEEKAQQQQQVDDDAACSPLVGLVKVCNYDYGESDWRATSSLYLKGRRVVAATIRLNDYYALDLTTEFMQYHLCHQMGHALGLYHGSDGCMAVLDASFVPPDMLEPGKRSVEELEKLYGNRRRVLRGTIKDAAETLSIEDQLKVVHFRI